VASRPAAAETVPERPLVSVVIAAYNIADLLPAAVDSALAQTYPNVEVIVVNDGSTDGTADVIAGYGPRVVTVTQENRGLASARNAGIRAARGELVGLLDGDDLWLPQRLDKLVPVLEARPDLGMVTSDSYMMDEDVATDRRLYHQQRKRPFPASEDLQIREIACYNFMFVSVLFRRELVDRFGMFTDGMRRAEDYDLWTRFLIGGTRAGFVDEPLGYYRIRAGSLSRTGEQAAAHLTVLEQHLPALWKLGARGNARDAYEIGTRLAASGDRRAALPFFLHSLTGEGARVSRLKYAVSSVRRMVLPSRDDAEFVRTAPPSGRPAP
jgi:glycosyltransferase involved in cell wall biosynthesis